MVCRKLDGSKSLGAALQLVLAKTIRAEKSDTKKQQLPKLFLISKLTINFNSHIDEICQKSSQKLNALLRILTYMVHPK